MDEWIKIFRGYLLKGYGHPGHSTVGVGGGQEHLVRQVAGLDVEPPPVSLRGRLDRVGSSLKVKKKFLGYVIFKDIPEPLVAG